jgi:DEAD/DEAH box helicase domain-containing protein
MEVSKTSIASVLAAWQEDPDTAERIVHIEDLPLRDPIYDRLDPALAPELIASLGELGVDRLYRHQTRTIDRARAGIHTVLVAGTASGKSMAYQIPIAERILGDPKATALLLYPTKALAQDQLRSFSSLDIDPLVAATYDGDVASEQRRWVRRHANVVLTNPDMLHISILPSHNGWADFLARLSFVVIDELHTFRGIFGSNVAHVLRRLRRLADHYGASPTFLFTSATIGNAAELASALIGLSVDLVEEDASPEGERSFVLWNPPVEDEVSGARSSPLTEATDVYVDLVRSNLHTIAFSRSRRATELMHRWASQRLDPEHADRIAPYRGGYLPEDRRRVEKALFAGELVGVTATNALELGIDVGGLDAAVITTFPGTIASMRQQAGRAGRNLRASLAVLVGGRDALDQYYMTHPDELFQRPAEAAVINPDNPGILSSHMGCAAYELPLVPEDRAYFGAAIEEAAPDLVADGDLRLRDGKLYWARRDRPARDVNIRSSGGRAFTIFDEKGRPLGTVDHGRAFSQTHPGAVYLHQGETYIVEDLDRELLEIRVAAADVDFYTQPKEEKDLFILDVERSGDLGRLGHHLGLVEVESQIVAYQRKAIGSGKVLATEPLDLPPQRLVTQAFWLTFPTELYDDAGIEWRDLPGTLHAAEHTAIAMLPLFAICDRWDVGGLSTALHPQTEGGVFFIYDGYDGGAGIAPIGFDAGYRHLEATLAALEDCPCLEGCPSCVVSPKCGNFNDPLDKAGAAALLRTALY